MLCSISSLARARALDGCFSRQCAVSRPWVRDAGVALPGALYQAKGSPPLDTLKTHAPGILLCAALAAPCYAAGLAFPVVGGPVFGILLGMCIALAWRKRPQALAKGV